MRGYKGSIEIRKETGLERGVDVNVLTFYLLTLSSRDRTTCEDSERDIDTKEKKKENT